jgi:hypothetical protein
MLTFLVSPISDSKCRRAVYGSACGYCEPGDRGDHQRRRPGFAAAPARGPCPSPIRRLVYRGNRTNCSSRGWHGQIPAASGQGKLETKCWHRLKKELGVLERMEPLSDYELEHLLNVWVAPNAPQNFEEKFFPRQFRWWQWLFPSRLLVSHGGRSKRPRKV